MIDLALPPSVPAIALPRPAIVMPSRRVITPAEARGIETDPPIGLDPALAAFGAGAGHGARAAALSRRIVYLGPAFDEVNRTTYIFTGYNFGAATANRRLYICVFGEAGAGGFMTLSSGTIGGSPAAVDVAVYDTFSFCGIMHADLGAGTSGTVTATMTSAVGRCGIIGFSIPHFTAQDAVASDTNGGTTPISVVDGGVIIATSYDEANSGWSFVGIDNEFSTSFGLSARAGFYVATADEASRSVGVSGSSADNAFCAVSLH